MKYKIGQWVRLTDDNTKVKILMSYGDGKVYKVRQILGGENIDFDVENTSLKENL